MNKHYVKITQYMRPNGRKTVIEAPVSEEHKKWCDEHQPILSVETITGGIVAIYGRKKEWAEEDEIILLAENSPGPREPSKILAQLINQLMGGFKWSTQKKFMQRIY